MQEESKNHDPAGQDPPPRQSTRIMRGPVDDFDPARPRLGRRESEPHSAEVSYLYDVLSANFPTDRATWDLHHYFQLEGEEIDVQFDISYFKGLSIPYAMSAYHASEHENRVPTLAVNVLSKSTWRADLSDTLEYCLLLKIPLYIVFCPYEVATRAFKPPFLRGYVLQEDQSYSKVELRDITLKEGGELKTGAILDVSKVVPFRLGLMERTQKFKRDLPLYRLVAIHPEKNQLLPSLAEQARAQAEQARAQAEQARAQAEQYKQELDKYRKKYGPI